MIKTERKMIQSCNYLYTCCTIMYLHTVPYSFGRPNFKREYKD